MHKIILLPFLLIVLGLSAQSTKKGFKLLEKADFEKANEIFREVLAENEQDPAAGFGLAMICGDDMSPFFDLLEAWSFATALKPNIVKLTPEELEIIGEYFMETEKRPRNIPVRKKMDYALETLEAKLIKYIREENNLEIVYATLEKFPEFRYRDNVIHIRNQLEFRKYEKQNTLEAYLEFIRKFPDAAQIQKAIRYRNQLAFEKARQINTLESYQDFLKVYPEANEKSMALKLLYGSAFQRTRELNTIAGYEEFMTAYPEALEIRDAMLLQKQLLYEYAKKIQTIEAYNEFIKKYPEGQQYIDIFNLKSRDSGMRIVNSQAFPSANLLWAGSFGSEENDELSAYIAVDSSEAYIAGGTVMRHDTGSSDAWIIKMASDGKMIWHKYVGEEYLDEIHCLEVNNRNEIFGTGYTWLGRDSASRQSWIFKLGQDGRKIWSKKLGNMKINCMLTTPEGTVFLGGSVVNDTSGHNNYSVLSLNESGKRLWSRAYTGEGQVVNLSALPDRHILLVGDHWHAKIDPRGYLGWESAFGSSDSILNALTLPRGEIIYIGLRNRLMPVLIKTGADNKVIFEKEITLSDTLKSAGSLFYTGTTDAVAILNFSGYQSIAWINVLKGEISKTVQMPAGMNITGIRKDRGGNLILAAYTGEILIIKNKGLAF